MFVIRLSLVVLAGVVVGRTLALDAVRSEATPLKLEFTAEAQPSKLGNAHPLHWLRKAGRSNDIDRQIRPARPGLGGGLGGGGLGGDNRFGGALMPILLAASSLLPMMFTALAALAGKALMSSLLALAVAAFNLIRSQRQQLPKSC